jgi:transcriptional regulator with AAA-type ATPase domain
MQALRMHIRQLAPFDTLGNAHAPTVLLQGETGTGKGLVAQVLHASGPRARGPFVAINCAAIPDTLLEAELFGFEAGAFSEARRAKPGLFEAASGGSLFLDEIDALPGLLQGKLLTVLEAKRVRRLGAVAERAVDVKLMAATQAVLSEAVAQGRFRADLYHRLAVVVLELPPLRARQEDILELAQASLQRYAAAHGLRPKQLSPAAAGWLRGYDWPGNVRELSHLMERVTLLSTEAILTPATLEQLVLPRVGPTAQHAPGPVPSASEVPDEVGRIRQALQETGGNVVQAARQLGLSRSGLRYRLQRYGLAPPRVRGLPHATRPAVPPPPPPEERGSAPREEVPTPAPETAPRLPPVGGLAEGERKLVTVLSGHVSPALSLLPGVDVEDQQVLMEQLEALVRAAIQPYAGTLEYLGSDRFRVVFGAPQAQEDHAHQALRAALAIRQQWAGFGGDVSPASPTPVALGLGLHTGQVVMSTPGDTPVSAPALVGDVLLLADHVAQHAGAETLLVSAATAHLLREAVHLDAGPAVPWPGQAAPLVTYRVADRLAVTTLEAGWDAQRRSPFVGRQGALATLHTHLMHVLAGHGQVVGLVGAHGMGKSRLLAEFRHSLAGQPVTYLAGQCQSYGSHTPSLPLLALLRQWWGITEGESLAARTTKVREGLSQAGLQPDDWASDMLQFLDGPDVMIPETERRPQELRARTFAALHHLFGQSSQRQPLVVVVENLHWIDPTSEEYLTALVERLSGVRLLLLVTYRPGYRPPWQAASIATQLALAPLTPADSREVVRAVRRGLPLSPAVEAQIVATAQGNPFFLEELTQAVLEQDADAATLVVPDTIQAALLARLDRLPPAAKQLLQTLAVLGREVPLSLLRAVVTLSDDAMHQHLRHLQSSELLYESRLAPEPVYTFTHQLIQEVAYQSLLRRTRRRLHAQIAQLLATQFADMGGLPPELLASHYTAAGRSAQAVPYWIQAGRQAIRRAAHVEASVHLTRGLAALQTLPASPQRTEHELTLQLLLGTIQGRRQRTLPL